jgi:hypothetical protein
MLRKTLVVTLIIGDKAKDATVYTAVPGVIGVTRPRTFVVLDRQLTGAHEFGGNDGLTHPSCAALPSHDGPHVGLAGNKEHAGEDIGWLFEPFVYQAYSGTKCGDGYAYFNQAGGSALRKGSRPLL